MSNRGPGYSYQTGPCSIINVSDLPDDIRKIIKQRQIEQHQVLNLDSDLLIYALNNWPGTPEGFYIWDEVNEGRYEPFYDYHKIRNDE